MWRAGRRATRARRSRGGGLGPPACVDRFEHKRSRVLATLRDTDVMAQPEAPDPSGLPPDPLADLHVRLIEVTVTPGPRGSRARDLAAVRPRAMPRALLALAVTLAVLLVAGSVLSRPAPGERAATMGERTATGEYAVGCLTADVTASGPGPLVRHGAPASSAAASPCHWAPDSYRRCLASLRAWERTRPAAPASAVRGLARARGCHGGLVCLACYPE